MLLILLSYFEELPCCTTFKTYHHKYGLQKIHENLNPDKALLGFHAFSGCYQTGKFYGISKKTCWEILTSSSSDVLKAFARLGSIVEPCEDDLELLEKFVLNLYRINKHSNLS